MYVLWSQTNETVDFSQNSETRPKTSIMRENFSSYHKNASNLSTSGMIMVQLLRADKLEIPEKLILKLLSISPSTIIDIFRNVKEVTIKLNKIKVPATDTTYWCRIQKLDDFVKTKHHIVQVNQTDHKIYCLLLQSSEVLSLHHDNVQFIASVLLLFWEYFVDSTVSDDLRII